MKYKALLSNYRTTVKQLLSFVLPILAAHQIGAIIPFLNTTLAGRHNPVWLAAIGLANTAFTAIMGFGWGIITSVGLLTASQLGKTQDIKKTGAILKASLLTALIISLPIMLILKYMQPIWLFFGQSAEIAQLSQEYLNGLLWIVFVDLAKFSIFQFAIAHHHVIAPLLATAASIPLMFITNSTLPQYFGVYGLGLGTALVYWVVSLTLWAYCYKDRIFSTCLSHRDSWRTYWHLVMRQFKLGAPIGAMSTIELLFFVVIGFWIGNMSTYHLVAHQIAMQWLCFTIMTSVSFSEAITILVAKAHAQHNLRKAVKFLWAGIWLTAICMTIISCLYWLTPHLLIRFDLGAHHNNPAIIALSITTLALCGAFQIFDGVRIAFSGGLRGLADTQYPMWITLIAFWGIGLPAAYFSAFILQWNHMGLWLGMTVAVIVMVGLQYNRIRRLLASLDEQEK
jgi:multidrug resistance protein, MATE family